MFAMLRYVMSCHDMIGYVMLCYIIIHQIISYDQATRRKKYCGAALERVARVTKRRWRRNRQASGGHTARPHPQ